MTGGPRSIGFRRAALHLGGLWALAFAQPLFDLLGENAQFFVARGSTRLIPASRLTCSRGCPE